MLKMQRLFRTVIAVFLLLIVVAVPAFASDDVTTYETDESIVQIIYDRIVAAIHETTQIVSLKDLNLSYENDQGLVRLAFMRAIYDNPERLDISHYYFVNSNTFIITSVTVLYNDTYTEEKKESFESAVSDALSGISETMSDLEKALVIHDYLAVQCDYNWETANGNKSNDSDIYNAYGCLVNGDAVCAGYASAYKLLMDRLGINCLTVSSETMNHAWNMVELDDDWYHVDVTWDDPVPNVEGQVLHKYFLLSDETMEEREHSGWDVRAVCENDMYETGYAFNEVTTPFYYHNNTFYYIKENPADYSMSVCYGPLNEEFGTAVYSDIFYEHRGVVWVEDHLYYAIGSSFFDPYIQFVQVDLTEGSAVNLGEEVAFVRTAVDRYLSFYDFVGLRLSEDGTHVEAVSSTRREVLYSVKIKDTDEVVEPEYIAVDGFDEQLGLVTISWNKEDAAQLVVLTAFYENGRYVGMSWNEIEANGKEIMSIDVLDDIPENYDSYCIMIVDANMVPQCSAYHA